jgi:antibiotic biosynthesis monooxygenase (ABM) superfamily enzyme
MSDTDQTCLLFVQMTVKKGQETAFNQWYENEYIPAFVRDIPGVARGRRFVTLAPDGSGTHTYLTIYEFTNERAMHQGLEVMKSRETWRKAWKDWEHQAVASISDNLFRTTANVEGPAHV